MASKTIVFITGANTGLGYEAVKALYKSSKPYEILLGCRSLSKGNEAIATLQKEVPSSQSSVSAVQVDIESDESIEQAYKTVSSTHARVDTLINNAGAGFDREIQEGKLGLREGFLKSWNVNVAGTEVVTNTFMPLLFKSKDPRLMFITSGTSALAETDKGVYPAMAKVNASPAAGWPKEKILNPVTSYRATKTGLNMLMREWTRILEEDPVKVFAISPGFLATGLGGLGPEKLKQIGAIDPSEGGNFVKDVVEGKRDEDVGKVIRASMIQPW